MGGFDALWRIRSWTGTGLASPALSHIQFRNAVAASLTDVSSSETICIVGTGLAGGSAAPALREAGFSGRVILVGAEGELPYDRPPLSKAYLTGKMPLEKLWLRPSAYYAEHGIELRTGVALALDPNGRRLEISDGGSISYERLLIATGSAARELAVPGARLDGVLTVRSLQDADRLRARLESRPRVLVVGAGFLGCELAAAARSLGCEVKIVEVGSAPMAAMGGQVSHFVAELHLSHGVPIECTASVVELRGQAKLEEVVLGDGRLVPCDVALVCVGAGPRLALTTGTGLVADGAIPVDTSCRSSDPNIFAAGDVAAMWHPKLGRRVRLEHWDNAVRQGRHAARAMMGDRSPYEAIPYFWSEQYDAMLQQVGLPETASELVLRGQPGEPRFSVFGLNGGLVVSCVAINQFRDLSAARRMIGSGQRVAASSLADPGVDLRSLVDALPRAL
jgi:3-phenylpropionate/trans-cinnamate dioxygenase ferredoxin reductase subunit